MIGFCVCLFPGSRPDVLHFHGPKPVQPRLGKDVGAMDPADLTVHSTG
jgi:hypothetical protein